MTLDRAAARARCEAATLGPWVAYNARASVNGTACMTLASLGGSPRPGTVHDGVWLADVRCDFLGVDGKRHDSLNSAFLAHARTDLPAALDELDAKDAEIARLRAEVARLEGRVAQ